jgi:hypothetical protein
MTRQNNLLAVHPLSIHPPNHPETAEPKKRLEGAFFMDGILSVYAT